MGILNLNKTIIIHPIAQPLVSHFKLPFSPNSVLIEHYYYEQTEVQPRF